MKTIHLMSGMAGSGKTTYSNSNCGLSPIVHRDEIRDNIRKLNNSSHYFPLDAEKEINAWTSVCTALIINNPDATDYWFDATFMTNHAIAKFINKVADSLPFIRTDFDFVIERMDVSLETAIRQNHNPDRAYVVPDDVITQMSRTQMPNSKLRDMAKIPDKCRITLHLINSKKEIEL